MEYFVIYFRKIKRKRQVKRWNELKWVISPSNNLAGKAAQATLPDNVSSLMNVSHKSNYGGKWLSY